jgi:hypothetical protein
MTTVTLEGFSPADAEKLLNEQVIPIITGLPGFQSGVWLRSADTKTGMGIVVFDSEDNAAAARDGMGQNRPAGAPPITSSDIYFVTGQA